MTREEVYKVIDSERNYQDTKWGGKAHDNYHEVEAWMIYMQAYFNRAILHISTEKGPQEALEQLRKVVALGIACFEIHGVPYRQMKEVREIYTPFPKPGEGLPVPISFDITNTDGSGTTITTSSHPLPNGSYNTQ